MKRLLIGILIALALSAMPFHAGAKSQFSGLQWWLKATNTPAAWQYTQGEGTIACIADTGVDATHPDLSGAVIGGINTVSPLTPNAWQDDNDHGTHVAGVIAGRGIDITGIAPKARLLVAKVLDDSGSADDGSVNAGLLWCINHGAQVINMSWGGPSAGWDGLRDIVAYGCKHGVDFVAAAGNDGTMSPTDPAAVKSPCLIAVAAENENGRKAAFSNYYENSREVVAPGVNIVSDYPNGLVSSLSGTSMATPMVTGELVLLRSLGDTSKQAVTDALITASRTSKMSKKRWGWGRIDIGMAARLAAGR